GLVGNEGLHQHLQQDIAQLLSQLDDRLLIDRFEHFIGLLEQGRPQRGVRLLAVPWAPLERAELPDHINQGCQPRDVVSHARPPTRSAAQPATGAVSTSGSAKSENDRPTSQSVAPIVFMKRLHTTL